MMGVSWGGLAGAFLAPYLYSLYTKKVTKAATVVCFIWGTALATTQFIISMVIPKGEIVNTLGSFLGNYVFKSSIHSGVFAMVGGLILVPIISAITPKMAQNKVDDAFECYEESVQVKKVVSLEEE